MTDKKHVTQNKSYWTIKCSSFVMPSLLNNSSGKHSPVPSLALCSGGNRHQHSYHLLPRFPGLIFVVNFSKNNSCLSHCTVPKEQDDFFQWWQLPQRYHVSSLTTCHCSRWHLPPSLIFFPIMSQTVLLGHLLQVYISFCFFLGGLCWLKLALKHITSVKILKFH